MGMIITPTQTTPYDELTACDEVRNRIFVPYDERYRWQEVIGLLEKQVSFLEKLFNYLDDYVLEMDGNEIRDTGWRDTGLFEHTRYFRNLLLVIGLRLMNKLPRDRQMCKKVVRSYTDALIGKTKDPEAVRAITAVISRVDFQMDFTPIDYEIYKICWKWTLPKLVFFRALIAYLVVATNLKKDKKRQLKELFKKLAKPKGKDKREDPFANDSLNARLLILKWFDAFDTFLRKGSLRWKMFRALAALRAFVSFRTGKEMRTFTLDEFPLDWSKGDLVLDDLGGFTINKQSWQKNVHDYFKKYMPWCPPSGVPFIRPLIQHRMNEAESKKEPLFPDLNRREGRFYEWHGLEFIKLLGVKSEGRGAWAYELRDLGNQCIKDICSFGPKLERRLRAAKVAIRLRDAHLEIASRVWARQSVASSWQGYLYDYNNRPFFTDVNFQYYDRVIGPLGHKLILKTAFEFAEEKYRGGLPKWEEKNVRVMPPSRGVSQQTTVTGHSVLDATKAKIAVLEQELRTLEPLLTSEDARRIVGVTSLQVRDRYAALQVKIEELRASLDNLK